MDLRLAMFDGVSDGGIDMLARNGSASILPLVENGLGASERPIGTL